MFRLINPTVHCVESHRKKNIENIRMSLERGTDLNENIHTLTRGAGTGSAGGAKAPPIFASLA